MRIIGLGCTVALAMALAVSPVEAKHKNKIKTVIGCVQGTANHYELATTTKKGKHKQYALVGQRDFSAEVGHKVRAHGAVNGVDLKVSSIQDLASSCR